MGIHGDGLRREELGGRGADWQRSQNDLAISTKKLIKNLETGRPRPLWRREWQESNGKLTLPLVVWPVCAVEPASRAGFGEWSRASGAGEEVERDEDYDCLRGERWSSEVGLEVCCRHSSKNRSHSQ